MITLIIHDLYTKNERHYNLEKLYDFDKLINDFGPTISGLIKDCKNVRSAVDKVAEYLSNNHLSAEIIDPEDSEDIYDPNIETHDTKPKNIKSAVDLRDMLETYDNSEYIDIPEYHVLNAAMHRWSSDLYKNETLFDHADLINKSIENIKEAVEADETIYNKKF